MSVEVLKRALTTLSAKEQGEVSAYLFFLRHRGDAAYQAILENRPSDRDASHWLTPGDFEKRLDKK